MLYQRKSSENYLTPTPLGQQPSEFVVNGVVDRAKLRECIANCTVCHRDGNVLAAPRHGTGYQDARLMIIGQNPPVDSDRALHGAWMLHYGPEYERGRHEKLVAELLDSLGVSTKEVFAANAMKCPTVNNETPRNWSQSTTCVRRFLQHEAKWANPRAFLVFGAQTANVLQDLWPTLGQAEDKEDIKLVPTPNSKVSWVSRRNNIIFAPHPSVVHRFVTWVSWRDALLRMFPVAETARRLPLACDLSEVTP